VDDTGNVTQNGQEDVDEEIGIATALKEDTERREDDGKDDLADVAGGERHSDRGLRVCAGNGWLENVVLVGW